MACSCMQVYAAPLQGGGRAVVLFNRHHPEYPTNGVTVRWDMLGFNSCEDAVVRDLYKRADLGTHAGDLPFFRCPIAAWGRA